MVTVRPSTARDIERCVAIVEGLPDYFTADVPTKVERDLGAHLGWVAVRAERVVGFAVVARRSSRAAEILWIAVDGAERGRGVGSALVDQLVTELGDGGVGVIEVKTLDQSADYEPYVATRAFWERHGFIQIDTIDPLPAGSPATPQRSASPRSGRRAS